MKTTTPLIRDTYIGMIKNSVGSNMFRNCYVLIDEVKKDATEDGRISCAFFASSILVICKLISEVHATVASTVLDMKKNNWLEIEGGPDLQIGDVIIWEEAFVGNSANTHIGFYIGDDQAISNSYNKQTPQIHHITYGTNEDSQPKRKIDQVWRYRFE